VNFAAQGVGTTSASQTVTLKNTSTTKTLSITSVTVSGEFPSSTTCGSSLAPSTTCTVTVSFSPDVIGAVDGAITFVDNAAPGTQVANLSGKGVASLTLSPTTLKFAGTTIGKTSAVKNVILTNSPTPLTMGTVSASGDYTIASNTCTGTIAANKTCTIGVTFTPTVKGKISGALTIGDGASSSPQVIALTGTGIGTVTNPVSFSPSSITFTNQPTGTTSASQSITLTNNGTSALSVATVAASGDYGETDTCAGQSIAASGGTCTINVSFTPTTTGSISGAITVTDAATTSPQVVPLGGTGINALTLSPTLLGFSGQAGVTGPPLSATLTNNSNNAVTLSNVAVSGDFIQTNTCAGAVAANSSCTFNVSFSPLAGGTIDGLGCGTNSGSG